MPNPRHSWDGFHPPCRLQAPESSDRVHCVRCRYHLALSTGLSRQEVLNEIVSNEFSHLVLVIILLLFLNPPPPSPCSWLADGRFLMCGASPEVRCREPGRQQDKPSKDPRHHSPSGAGEMRRRPAGQAASTAPPSRPLLPPGRSRTFLFEGRRRGWFLLRHKIEHTTYILTCGHTYVRIYTHTHSKVHKSQVVAR